MAPGEDGLHTTRRQTRTDRDCRPSSYGAPVGKAWIDDVKIVQRSRPNFRSPPVEDFPALVTDAKGQVWLAVVSRPVPHREIRVFRVGQEGRKLIAHLRPEGITGIGSPALAPLEDGCLIAFGAEQNDRWGVATAGSRRQLHILNSATSMTADLQISNQQLRRWKIVTASSGNPMPTDHAAFTPRGWTRMVRHSRSESAPQHVSLNPSVVATDDGTVWAVWDSVRGTESDLYGAKYSDGAGTANGGSRTIAHRTVRIACRKRFGGLARLAGRAIATTM